MEELRKQVYKYIIAGKKDITVKRQQHTSACRLIIFTHITTKQYKPPQRKKQLKMKIKKTLAGRPNVKRPIDHHPATRGEIEAQDATKRREAKKKYRNIYYCHDTRTSNQVIKTAKRTQQLTTPRSHRRAHAEAQGRRRRRHGGRSYQ